MRIRIWLGSLVGATLLLGFLSPVPTHAGPAQAVVPSAFFIAKSENKNQVHYAVQVDEHCVPRTEAPVYPYWRMLERGSEITEGLVGLEHSVYGVGWQKVLDRREDGGTVRVSLRALPSRGIDIRTHKNGSSCAVESVVTIGALPARLNHVFADVAWPLGARNITLHAVRVSDGQPVREMVSR